MNEITQTWLKLCSPDYLDIVMDKAPLDYSYLLILEYENQEKLFAVSRYPAKYVNTHISRERQNGVNNPVRVYVSSLIFRGESVKRILQKKLADFRNSRKGRYLIPETAFTAAIKEVFSVVRLDNSGDNKIA